MATLITGGNGKTGLNLAALHHANNKPFFIASRSGTSPDAKFASSAVKFDWYDRSTYEIPFNTGETVDKLYLIAPPGFNSVETAKSFLDLAVEKGVKRIVFLSASDCEKGDDVAPPGNPFGKIHEYLDGLNAVWYAVLRPTWFQENLAQTYASTINSTDAIHTCCGNGLIPFVSAKDIAQAAYVGLFAHENGQDDIWPRGREPRILGPELMTYDDVAALISSAVGRKITHVHLAKGEAHPAWDTHHIPQPYQELLEWVESRGAEGQEYEYFTGKGPEGAVDKYVGKRTMKEYIENEKNTWMTNA